MRYPQITIYAENYPAPWRNQILARIINYTKLALLALIIFGEHLQIFQRLNIGPPAAYTWAINNKIMACIAVFFLGNSLEGALLQTGAFEVSYNGLPVWSKLKSGRLPQPDELYRVINSHLELSNPAGFGY